MSETLNQELEGTSGGCLGPDVTVVRLASPAAQPLDGAVGDPGAGGGGGGTDAEAVRVVTLRWQAGQLEGPAEVPAEQRWGEWPAIGEGEQGGGVGRHRGVELQVPAHGSTGAGWVPGSVKSDGVALAQLVGLGPLEEEGEVC